MKGNCGRRAGKVCPQTKDKRQKNDGGRFFELGRGDRRDRVSTLGLKRCVSLAKEVSRQWFKLQGSCSEPRMAHGLWIWAGMLFAG